VFSAQAVNDNAGNFTTPAPTSPAVPG